MKHRIAFATLLVLSALSSSALATNWVWSLSGSHLPGGTGTFSACEATTKTQLTGNYTRPSSGFVHLSSPSCANSCTVTNGACSSCTTSTSGSCSGIPTDIYAIELPGVHLIVQPVLTSPAETQPIYNVVAGACPSSAVTNYNFDWSQWSSSNDTSSSSQIGMGTFSWNTNGTASVTGTYNLTSFASLGRTFSLPNSGCSGGTIPVTGTANSDESGTIYITNQGEFFYQTTANHAVFGVPQVAINNPSTLMGSYSGFVYDAGGSNTVVPVTQMVVGSGASSISGYKLTSDSTIDTSFVRQFNFSSANVNQPVNGMIEGTLSDGTNTTNMACIASLGAFNYNSLFCAGQKPGSVKTPYNMLLISAPTIDLANLRGNWDAQYSTLSGSTWKDETANGYNATLGAHATWVGAGTAASPYAVTFDGSSTGLVDFGSSVMSGQTQMMFQLWINPGAVSSTGTVILGDSSNGTGNGFTLRQSATSAGKLELVIGNGTLCTGTTSLTNGSWFSVGGLYDGANATLLLDGRQECTVAASSGFTSPSTHLVAGATASGGNPWTGSIANLKMYTTSDGSSAGTATNLSQNYATGSDQFRTTTEGSFVTSGLELNLDAANALAGNSFPGTGCSVTSWYDLSPGSFDGTLSGFTSCSTYGWQGAGSTASPYALVFDGTADSVGTSYTQTSVTAYTIEAWVKTTDTGAEKAFVQDRGAGSGMSLTLGVGKTGGNRGGAGLAAFELDSNNTDIGISSTTAINDGSWHQLVGTWSGTSGAAVAPSQFNLYIDDALATVTSSSTGTATAPLSGLGGTTIGSHAAWNTYLNGSIANVKIYNRALSAAEIVQNCRALEARFSGLTCH